MSGSRQPKGIPAGGQFAASRHGDPVIGLRGTLHVDREAAMHFADQVESIQAEGLQGAISAHEGCLTFTSNDGRSFNIRQDGYYDQDGSLGWSIDNHDVAEPHDPVYGLRRESRTENLGEDLAEQLAIADSIEAFTLKAGSDGYDFSSYDIDDSEGPVKISARFVDTWTHDDLDVYYDADAKKLTVYYDDSEVTGKEADEVLRGLVSASDLDAPEGSPTGQMAWHLERSLRIAAAKHDSPAWMHQYRTAGLTWEDRNDGR